MRFVEQLLLSIEQDRSNDLVDAERLAAISVRAAEVNALADMEDEVFGKPVHAKILVDLALDPEFNPASFKGNVTRWSLYSEFFAMLARRETNKAARSPIEAADRLEFLRRIALWLWEEKDGVTSFRASDIPAHILTDLAAGDAEDDEDKRREYLAGAFLERKASDTFFFPHRSFAEFLVAEQLVSNPPSTSQHTHYDRLASGGVQTFLTDAPPAARVGEWGGNLGNGSGILSMEYLLFLASAAGGLDILADSLSAMSPWRPIVALMALPMHAVEERRQIIAETLVSAPWETATLLLCGMTRFWVLLSDEEIEPSREIMLDYGQVVVAALLTRLMRALREDNAMPRHTLPEAAAPLLKLARASMELDADQDSRAIYFSWKKLGEVASTMADTADLSINGGPSLDGMLDLPDERIAYFTVRNIMPSKESQFLHQMVSKRGWLNTITIVSQR